MRSPLHLCLLVLLVLPPLLSSTPLLPSSSPPSLFSVRGGAQKKSKSTSLSSLADATKGKSVTGKPSLSKARQTKTAASDALEKYKKILPLTRIYMSLCIFESLSSLIIGDECAQSIYALTSSTLPFQPFRFITAASFLGAPSISSLMSVYYLFEYGSQLEQAYGTATFACFLLAQTAMLSALSTTFGSPFFAASTITAMLHVLSRQAPMQNVKWLIFNVPYWTLPYGLMMSDVLQAQSASAALPHVMGILTGHTWHFHKYIYPGVTGNDWLVAPDWLRARFDEDGVNNVKKGGERKVVRRKGKGRKLGAQ